MLLLEYFRMDSSRRLTSEDLPKEKFSPQLISGIFLACGSVNNPEKKYHLEFVMPTLELCNDVGALIIDNFNIIPKHTERKNSQVVYIKESENIIDLLTIMGAVNSSFDLINMKIYIRKLISILVVLKEMFLLYVWMKMVLLHILDLKQRYYLKKFLLCLI